MIMDEDVPCELDLVELGKGNFDLKPRDGNRIPHSTLPFDLPPVLPDLRDQLENFLSDPQRLPIHSIDFANRLPAREPNVASLFTIDVSPLQTTLQVERDLRTGQLLNFREVEIVGAGANAKNSMSLQRMPGSLSDGVMGSNTNFPFVPGGMEDLTLESLQEIIQEDIDFENNLLKTPPGFKEGMEFKRERGKSETTKDSISLAEILAMEDTLDLMGITEETEPMGTHENVDTENQDLEETVPEELKDELEQVVSKEVSEEVLKISNAPKRKVQSTEWATVVDITQPVYDFHKSIPNMAHTWPFELDTFQKQAILHLENHDSVFVAAHTSAGKTVVAEYAVALALKHGTKAVYTSPVKALSNQKFRDFKTTFKDIGLLTGDVQVNSEASCLIMTTEILRSMLYNGSDIIRELEWVIFDEVHYINDKERGVVWEEVLIMLPKPVKLVLLSATVSNTVELADWVGRTKQKMLYVISTSKRPVPLEHYLYTGSVGKQQNEMFLVVDSQGNFLDKNYKAAVLAKKDKAGKLQNYGPRTPRQTVNMNQEKNIYRGVIAQLQKDERLPVVCFTLSRKRCNDNANMMSSLDLTTAKEKNSIHKFFTKSIAMLKEVDRKLPQVLNMKKLLDRGLGIHHSGILPILKEVVEMLFQEGCIKVLFATETFAMGVNMPARTVVFDNTRKHDGVEFRDLLSSEYIQMAGRAGRRGLDKTGTVLILCKSAVPEMSALYTMMLGKPTELESKFRLTYIMILNLIRAKQLKIEEVMKRSFGEAKFQKDKKKKEKSLQSIMSQLASLTELSCGSCMDIEQYCQSLKRYFNIKKDFMKNLPTTRNSSKILSPGRVVTVSTDYHLNVPGMMLTNVRNNKFFVLILADRKEETGEAQPSVAADESEVKVEPIHPWTAELFYPPDSYNHFVLEKKLDSLQAVGNATLPISAGNADKILKSWNRCQEPRFRDEPPSSLTVEAVQELCKIAKSQRSGLVAIRYTISEHHNYQELEEYEKSFNHFNCISCPSFKEHLNHTNKNLVIQESVAKIRYLLSDESLQLLPEYQGRIVVLMKLGYIDEHKMIKLKGRVACQMSSHELLLTEILIRNLLTDCSPAESAALLSCFVFQQKAELQIDILPNTLQKGIGEIKKIARELDKLHVQNHILEDEFESDLKFGLTGVVHEWGKGMLFADIAKMTEVEEGIIVRTIQRLVEVLKDVRNAAHIFGDETLRQKMDDALQAIKRDIVFAASLYVQ